MGIDDVNNMIQEPGVGAIKENGIIKVLSDGYGRYSFVDDNGGIMGRAYGVYETALMVKHGYKPENRLQRIYDGCVLPREVLCPISWIGMPDMYTENTLTVHKYDDLLIDGKGAEAAYAQRKQIEALMQSAGLVK